MDELGFHALIDDAAVAVVPRCVVLVEGEGALGFLEDTGTQEVAALKPGSGALTCFLDEKGRVQAEARVLVAGEGVLLDGEPAARDYLLGWLARIAPLAGCTVIEQRAVVTALRGGRAIDALAFDLPPSGEHDHVEQHGLRAVRVQWGLEGFDVFAPADDWTPAARRVDEATLEAARIAAGRPRFGIDITSETLINETPLLARAVSMTKGCYPGQESVARVHNLGRVRRRLVGLTFKAGPAPAPGAPVLSGDHEVGAITSAASTPGGAAAIARVRAEVEAGSTVTVGDVPAVVRAL